MKRRHAIEQFKPSKVEKKTKPPLLYFFILGPSSEGGIVKVYHPPMPSYGAFKSKHISVNMISLLYSVLFMCAPTLLSAKWVDLLQISQRATPPSPITYTLSIFSPNGSLPSKNIQVPQGFIGFSLEWQLLNNSLGNTGSNSMSYTDTNPIAVNLFKQVQPNASSLKGKSMALLRIGGNSAIKMGWGLSKFPQPAPFGQPLGVTVWPGDLQLLNQFAYDTGYGLVLDVSMLDAAPDRTLEFIQNGIMKYIDPRNIWSIQLGNEPDNWVVIYYRPTGWQFDPDYLGEYKTYATQIKNQISGWTNPTSFGGGLGGMQVYLPQWIAYLPRFLQTETTSLVQSLTFNRYPLTVCDADPAKRQRATIPLLLADPGETGLDFVDPVIAAAKAANIPAYLGEGGVASCSGAPGVSDSFASALWGVDMLLDFALRGLSKALIADPRGASQGISKNIATNGPFIFDVTTQAVKVRPIFYAMSLVSQLFQEGSSATIFRPVSFTPVGPAVNMRAFAIYDSSNFSISTVIINKDYSSNNTQTICLSFGINSTQPPPSATITRLTGPSAAATAGVLLANQTYDDTSNGYIRRVATYETVAPNADGTYTVNVDALSIAVVRSTIPTGMSIGVPTGTATSGNIRLRYSGTNGLMGLSVCMIIMLTL
ncbi:beta-glucuronidase [Synchytrium endobioticum]|uniref:Beta-glucuronidase n=1 Tax=Synchytrium endobioticum TaxID=286115 RepID=A0A507D8P0_9FUNG|nr:beta-glucuronidase [Synchytrium endobioticum]